MNMWNYSILHPVRILWVERKILTDSMEFWKEMNFPHQEGHLLLPRSNDRPKCGHVINEPHMSLALAHEWGVGFYELWRNLERPSTIDAARTTYMKLHMNYTSIWKRLEGIYKLRELLYWKDWQDETETPTIHTLWTDVSLRWGTYPLTRNIGPLHLFSSISENLIV